MPFASLEGLRQEMIRLGVVRLLFKVLSTNDNSKQQIYLGSGYDSLKMIPGGELHAEPGLSRKHGASPRQIIKSALDFWWLNDDGESVRAPHAQLILYPQYPEVRMSGFLKGCAASPGALMSSRTAGRILFLGITEGGRIFGWLEDAGSAIANEAMQWIETGGTPPFSCFCRNSSSTSRFFLPGYSVLQAAGNMPDWLDCLFQAGSTWGIYTLWCRQWCRLYPRGHVRNYAKRDSVA